MPVTYDIDTTNEIVFFNATGEFTAEDFRIHKRELVDDPEFDPLYGVLIDFRSITKYRLSTAETRELAMSYIFHKRARRAYLVPTDEVYGMLRMFALLSDFESDKFQIFRDMAEARRWLGLDQAKNSK